MLLALDTRDRAISISVLLIFRVGYYRNVGNDSYFCSVRFVMLCDIVFTGPLRLMWLAFSHLTQYNRNKNPAYKACVTRVGNRRLVATVHYGTQPNL